MITLKTVIDIAGPLYKKLVPEYVTEWLSSSDKKLVNTKYCLDYRYVYDYLDTIEFSLSLQNKPCK